MTQYSTVVDVLRTHSKNLPDKIAYRFLADGEAESGSLTYQQLETQVQAIAAQLQAISAPGDRILLVYPYTAGLEFIASFFGCLYAGAIAVTMNPIRDKETIIQLLERAEACQATVVLTIGALKAQIQEKVAKVPELAAKISALNWIAIEDIPLTKASEWVEPDINSETLAFFQHTSGSTGKPKGVMVSHGNILHNSEVIYKALEHSPDSRFVSWLPMFHDMGLIGGVLQPMYGGFPSTLMSPVALIQKPIRWLQAVSKYRATTSGGPNFAYDLVARQATPEQLKDLDFSAWDVAFSGAETVRAATLERFAQALKPYGFKWEAFYPCYGMAESTLLITGGEKSQPPMIKYLDAEALEENRAVDSDDKSRAVVGCGRVWLGDEIIIVNSETNSLQPDGEIGEIWMAGDAIGKGYWQQPEATEKFFKAFIGDRGPFLRTGDLGFIEDGELFITGRIKDVMILWGRYRYPQDIEVTVEKAHPALRPCNGAAFSIEADDDERLVIVQEVERSFVRKLNVEEVVGAIRQAVAQEHTVEVYAIALIKTGSISKTTSGKIQRQACRKKFLEGTLNVVGEWRLPQQESSVSDLASS